MKISRIQIEMINNAMAAYSKTEPSHPAITPLSVCVAMSQAYIGYDLQNALKEELLNRGIKKNVATVITQVRVDENDPAFEHPTKPSGQFMTKEEADAAVASSGIQVMEDAGRGYRRVVASPKPAEIIEIDTFKDLLEAGEVVIASGGGGIPVIRRGNHLKGVGAVIDKDFASQRLAELVEADLFIVLTGVDYVFVNYNKPDQEKLEHVNVAQLEEYIKQDQFAPGSMLPKVEAAIAFVNGRPEGKAVITSLENLGALIESESGTIIVKD